MHVHPTQPDPNCQCPWCTQKRKENEEDNKGGKK
jgi:hypothetical protein